MIEKKYKFITIEETPSSHIIRSSFNILNNKAGNVIGRLFYYPSWHQYVFHGYDDCVFNNSCLRDILDFMENEIPK